MPGNRPKAELNTEPQVELDSPGPVDNYYQFYSKAKESGTFGDYASAADDYAMAASLARVFGEDDERLMDSLSRLAYCHYRLGALEEAESAYREALTLMERYHKGKHPDRFASILWSLAVLLCDDKRFEESVEFFKRSMAVSQNWAGPYDRFVADCFWGLSKAQTGAGQLEAAEESIKQAIEIYEHLAPLEGAGVKEFLSVNYSNLGVLLMQGKRFEEATQFLEKALKLRPGLDQNRVALLNRLSTCYLKTKNYDRASRLIKSNLKGTAQLFGANHAETIRLELALANCFDLNGRPEDSINLFKKTKKKLEGTNLESGTEAALMAACLFEMVLCYQKLDEQNNLKSTLEEIVNVYEGRYPDGSGVYKGAIPTKGALYADCMVKLGEIENKRCRYKKARACLSDALIVRKLVFGEEHKLVADCLLKLAEIESRLNLPEAAEKLRAGQKMLRELRNRA